MTELALFFYTMNSTSCRRVSIQRWKRECFAIPGKMCYLCSHSLSAAFWI